jgi:dGTPase
MEHALHVASISSIICKELRLSVELANAISIGHDLGHAPFGHHGESVLNNLWNENIEGIIDPAKKKKYFWHEKNSLFMVDNIETVKDDKGFQNNLNLTYGVRDGIICHYGEKTVRNLKPRIDDIDLSKIIEPGTVSPFTWEGCVVRAADAIAYVGRDIEDAEMSEIIEKSQLDNLKTKINNQTSYNFDDISNGVVIHELILDLCKTSTPEAGISFSTDGNKLIKILIDFDYKKIYFNERVEMYKTYIDVVLKTIFNELGKCYDDDLVKCLLKLKKKNLPVFQEFRRWIERYNEPIDHRYTEDDYISGYETRNQVTPTYNITNEKEYKTALIHYISGFTDNFALSSFEDVISII